MIDWGRAGQYTQTTLEKNGSPAMDAEPMPLRSPRAQSAGAVHSRDERVEAMVERYFDLIWRSLRRLGVDDGSLDDATQQVFIVATRKLDAIELEGERAYLLGIAIRVASDMRRTRTRRREVPSVDGEEQLDPRPSPEELVDQKRARLLLDRVLLTMPMDLRAAFTMFEIEGMSGPEVSIALGVPLGTVSSRLRRARELFREQVRQLTERNGGVRV